MALIEMALILFVAIPTWIWVVSYAATDAHYRAKYNSLKPYIFPKEGTNGKV